MDTNEFAVLKLFVVGILGEYDCFFFFFLYVCNTLRTETFPHSRKVTDVVMDSVLSVKTSFCTEALLFFVAFSYFDIVVMCLVNIQGVSTKF